MSIYVIGTFSGLKVSWVDSRCPSCGMSLVKPLQTVHLWHSGAVPRKSSRHASVLCSNGQWIRLLYTLTTVYCIIYIYTLYIYIHYIYIHYIYIHYIYTLYIYTLYTSSTAQGGGGSFKNRKHIGKVGCCASWMADRLHWWTEGGCYFWSGCSGHNTHNCRM